VARRRNFSPWAYWRLQLDEVQLADPLPALDADLVAWRERVRARLTDRLGPDPQAVPLDVEIGDEVALDGYTRARVVFDSEATMSVPAFLLVPDARRDGPAGPAVLAVHGHGPGKAAVCAVEGVDTAGGAYAHELARRGYVVLAPDLRCFGERSDPRWDDSDKYECDWNLVAALMAGRNPLAQNLWDMRRSLDVLAKHPLVDPARLGVAGLSYGGTITLFLAALDERVRVAVVSGYLSSWRAAHTVPWNMCGSQILPGLLADFEHVDIAALIAPRALLAESGTDDLIFPVAAARDTVAQLHRVYAALGAPDDALVHDVFEGGHQWHGELAYDFFARHL
jgi:dienelactone hydrolase